MSLTFISKVKLFEFHSFFQLRLRKIRKTSHAFTLPFLVVIIKLVLQSKCVADSFKSLSEVDKPALLISLATIIIKYNNKYYKSYSNFDANHVAAASFICDD